MTYNFTKQPKSCLLTANENICVWCLLYANGCNTHDGVVLPSYRNRFCDKLLFSSSPLSLKGYCHEQIGVVFSSFSHN